MTTRRLLFGVQQGGKQTTYLIIGFGWIIAAGFALAACRMAAEGDGDRSTALGLRKRLPLAPSDKEE